MTTGVANVTAKIEEMMHYQSLALARVAGQSLLTALKRCRQDLLVMFKEYVLILIMLNRTTLSINPSHGCQDVYQPEEVGRCLVRRIVLRKEVAFLSGWRVIALIQE